MTASENLVRHCPKCGSVRVHRSRRRGPVERLLTWFGANICRCHDCRARQAWFGLSPVPVGNADPEAPSWIGLAMLCSACLGATGILVWVLRR
jgi:predicted RNA-binding Zn-ribbon protein involved in translation (DUF1610 family)